MRYLLDVSVLLALGIQEHQFNSRVETWLRSIAETETPRLATCSITELGFIRIASQEAFGFTLEEATRELGKLKRSKNYDFVFIDDGNDVSKLPNWVKTHKQTTDGHLSELARSNGSVLATLDTKIPNTFVIPT